MDNRAVVRRFLSALADLVRDWHSTISKVVVLVINVAVVELPYLRIRSRRSDAHFLQTAGLHHPR
jgi:hypothetical protein